MSDLKQNVYSRILCLKYINKVFFTKLFTSIIRFLFISSVFCDYNNNLIKIHFVFNNKYSVEKNTHTDDLLSFYNLLKLTKNITKIIFHGKLVNRLILFNSEQ